MSNDEEVKCYALGMPNLPLRPNRRVRAFMKWVKKLDGFMGIHTVYPKGTLFIFKTENDAKVARNKVQNYEGYSSGVGNIVEIFIPKE